MPSQSFLSADELDDLIYFTRTGDLDELRSSITSLAITHSSSPDKIITAAIDNSDPSTSSGCSLLHWSAANGHIDVLEYLLGCIDEKHTAESGAPANSENTTAPSAEGDGLASKKLFQSKKGGLVNYQNNSGNTALHWAALNGKLECVKLLVRAGADPGIRNAAGKDSVFEGERGEVNRRGDEDPTVEEQQGGEARKREVGVVDWLLENCEGLDKGLEGETTQGTQEGEGSMDLDG